MSPEGAIREFRFPDLGEGLTEGTVVELRVKPGDRVRQGDALAVVETDKVVTEIPAPVDGVVVEIPISPKQVVKVGEVVARFKVSQSEAASVVGRLDGGHREVLVASLEGMPQPSVAGEAGPDGERPRASPIARKLAADAGIDLATLTGTGPGGRVLKRDVIARGASAGATRLSTMRLAIATAMEKSQSIPSAVIHDFTLADPLLALRRDLNESLGVRVGLLPFFVKAVALALNDAPLLGTWYYPERKEYETPASIDIGIAVDTEEGLVVPVVRKPATQKLASIQEQIERLAERAKSRTLLLEEIRGGAFTISNYGSAGGTYGKPMILPPQVGILGIGRVHQQPVVKDGAVVPAAVLPLSLVIDHRMVDGV
ncbi:MAG TPA: dihydrolipoamide acetyltransferase family protein, partial [Spirochaetia bacterium]|nr:dihydrolipoamide acetyltransferase family protein [Spirochaetia bacterium]